MFDWITKPYIQWNFIDSLICLFEILGAIILFVLVMVVVSIIKDKLKKKGE